MIKMPKEMRITTFKWKDGKSQYRNQMEILELKKKSNDPAIPLLGIYLEKTLIQKDTCTPMFTAALFTIAKTWKQPKCPSTEA